MKVYDHSDYEYELSEEALLKMEQVEEHYANRITHEEIISRLISESEARQAVKAEKNIQLQKAFEELVSLGLSAESASIISNYYPEPKIEDK